MHVKIERTSRAGRLYFWFYQRIRECPPEKEDTCHLRKILFLALPLKVVDWFANIEVPGIRIRLVYVLIFLALGAFFVWQTEVLLVILILFAMAAIALGGIYLIEGAIRRVDSFLTRFEIWERFKEAKILGRLPVTWTLAVIGILVLQVFSFFKAKLVFLIISIIEALLLVVLLLAVLTAVWSVVDEKYEIANKTKVMGRKVKESSTAIGKPIQTSASLIKILWKSLKDRVCHPVVWV
jgi:hypothetical protein